MRIVMVAAMLFVIAGGTATASEPIVLSGDHISLSLDRDSGVITQIEDQGSGITLAAPKGTAANFRLMLQKPDKSTVRILGKDQKPSAIEESPGKITLRWNGPLTDTDGGAHDIAARMDITTADGALTFTLQLANHTAYKVMEAVYPEIGGLGQLHATGKPCDATLWIPTSYQWQKPLAPGFETASFAYPGGMCMSFAAIHSPSANRSLYFSSQDAIARYKVYWFLPQTGTDGAQDVSACIQHQPFTPPGATFDGSPVTLRFVDGDWRACGQAYREWFGDTFGITQPSQCWVRRESFFLMTMFMLPEGTITFTFKDIPKWAKAAKDHGINAVQISGWQMSGHDNGYPMYTPDPRLGTWKDLEDGIRACHKMGMKVYFFVNYQPVMVDSDWYRNDLHKYREMTADGGYTWLTGWGMGTLWARMGHPWNMTWADPAFPEFRKIIVDQFAKLAEIGADGVHVDKMFPAAIDYNPDLPLSPDTAAWEGAITLTKEVMTACRKYQPDWAMSFECNWDRMLQFSGATWWVGNQVITRQVFPENAETLGLYEGSDYLGVNNAVRGGHVVMVAPLAFCRNVDWPPFHDLADYVKEVKRIRDSLQETVFYGEVRGHTGVTIEGEPDRGIEYNVFRNRENGRRVCVITNSSMTNGALTIGGFDGGLANARIQAPSAKTRIVSLPATIEVPAERIVFAEETDAPATDHTGATAKEAIVTTRSAPVNGGFESGDFSGWIADPNWVVVDTSCGYYSGWRGKYWAWSGGRGEPATGVLRSKAFVLDKDGVQILISGWNSLEGSGKPRTWNYVSLNLEDGTELDRVYAPNTTAFVPVILDGSRRKGQRVYVQAVDDADAATYSMLCVDDVRTVSLPDDLRKPIPALPASNSRKSVKLENDEYLVEVSRANGSLTRIRDKKGGIDLILEPRLAGSFKFGLVLPGKEIWQRIDANWIFGREQKLSSYGSDGGKLTLVWNGPLRNYLGESYDVSVTETIELTRGGILLNMSIDNRTPYAVGEVYFPIIAGVQGLGETRAQLKATELVRPAAGDALTTTGIFRVFTNMNWLGDHGPEQFYAYPDAQPEPWFGISNAKVGRSVYIGAHDPNDRKLVVRLELLPTGSGTVREDGNWPRVAEMHGRPLGVELNLVDIANVTGPVYMAAPVFIKFAEGDAASLHRVHTTWEAAK